MRGVFLVCLSGLLLLNRRGIAHLPDALAPVCSGTDEIVARAGGEREAMIAAHTVRVVQSIATASAVLFGVATLVAGGRVLLGSDPGYEVFRPRLIYNTTMGVAYVVAGITIWRSFNSGRYAAGAIFLLNLVVLVAIIVVYHSGGPVAVDSLRAMTLRAVVWLVLFLAVSWLVRSRKAS